MISNAGNDCSNALRYPENFIVPWKETARNSSGAQKMMKLQLKNPWPKPTKTQKWFGLIWTSQNRPPKALFSPQ